MAVARCGTGKAASTVDQEEISGGKRSRYVMIACADGAEGQSARLSALKKAREAFAEGEHARRMSEAMRAKVAADLKRRSPIPRNRATKPEQLRRRPSLPGGAGGRGGEREWRMSLRFSWVRRERRPLRGGELPFPLLPLW